ncbi:hypothetical protein RSJ44_004671 [Yersinia enterocolitica]|uniref:hypothetical protein n=1 Tax=Yersinia enterocolitica TaxID=630 RepID=UPI0021E8D598|nr:hypothetical protein [Yersinia enterocolitica]EKN3948548.1 hypothetical protein [Yersinia enterocolitica]EKN3982668.1 hypothetical protein [Yersinia enterocolitica]EKN3987065.1 hypothetical protein [Yersinia enterocolitica]EKN4111947.1 hypothetical protein [Yersinia enterocolitica]EKN5942806.1 hypothetical protein [Yersinia enterocolitica]
MDEKISYLLPFARVGVGKHNFAPVLTYECDALPVKASIDIAFYFICLKNNEVYRLWFDIKKEGKSIIDDSWDRNKTFKAEDPESKPNEIAVGLNVNLPEIPFDQSGIYEIEAKLFLDSRPELPISVNSAFFKVKGNGVEI